MPTPYKMKPIHTEKEYEIALQRVEILFDAKKGTPEGDELEVLLILIDKYEKENFPIDLPDPIEAIKFRMEQLEMKPKDLADLIGYKSRVSEILNRKRKLTLDMIRKLHVNLNIPTDVLVQDYESQP
jgi:HTH-type transcriptional regulator / antitoxin HigA